MIRTALVLALLQIVSDPVYIGRTPSGIAFDVQGTGPAVVLITGSNLDRRMWANEAAWLKADFKVVRYDLRGHGQTDAPQVAFSHVDDLFELLDQLHIEKASLVGLSAGSTIALDAALQSPERIARIVVAAPAISGYAPKERPAFFTPLMASLQQRDYSAAAEVMLASPLFQVPDASRALVRSMVTENDKLWTIPRELMKAPRPAAERLERVQTPTLVLVGDRDLGAQREQAEVLSRRIQNASLVVVPGGGHMLNLTSPGAFRDLVSTFLASSRAPAQTSQAAPHSAEHHEFVIDNFKTESGVTLPKARIVYGTYGKLNAARDNAVLLPSHYMATHHGYEWLIGPDRALDTGKLFLVATELFGNGHSSSPSNTPEPFHGPRFPVTTIRDNVDAVHRLLAEELKVTHVRAVVGFSMGAQQAFQWAVSYPDFADRIVATAGTAKTWPHGVVRLEGQIAALTADPAFNGGDYAAPPRKGIEAYGMVWLGWLYSQEW